MLAISPVRRVTAVVLVLIAGGINLLAQTAYTEIDLKNGGTLRGTVRVQGSNNTPTEKMFCTKDVPRCGKMKSSPRLCLGKANGVANSIVCLEGISQGKKFDRAARATLTQE